MPELASVDELGGAEAGDKRLLNDFRAIVLTDVSEIHSEQQAASLERFVRAGGTLMVFMGESVSQENYNRMLFPRGLLPGKLAERVTVGAEAKGLTFDFTLSLHLARTHPAKWYSGCPLMPVSIANTPPASGCLARSSSDSERVDEVTYSVSSLGPPNTRLVGR